MTFDGREITFPSSPYGRGRKDGAEGYRLPTMDMVASVMSKDQGIFANARQIKALAGHPRP